MGVRVTTADAISEPVPLIERGALRLYYLYDLCDSIDLERARAALAASTRIRPVVTRGANVEIAQLPLAISLGPQTLTLGEQTMRGQLRARIYDLGIVAFDLALDLTEPITWDEAAARLGAVQSLPAAAIALFGAALGTLVAALAPAMERPNATVRTEEYTLLLVERLGPGIAASRLGNHPAVLRAALGERRPLSAAASALATALSYYEDDLILLTWASAIIIDPDSQAREDATFLLEFANAQLLAFRSFDAQVERDLARITPRIARPRPPRWTIVNPSATFQREIHQLIADITDTSARVENALKVTEDVYWNRVYTAALTTLRVNVWRGGVAEGIEVLRQSAAMLNDEAEAARSTLLEILVIALILFELIVALLGLRH